MHVRLGCPYVNVGPHGAHATRAAKRCPQLSRALLASAAASLHEPTKFVLWPEELMPAPSARFTRPSATAGHGRAACRESARNHGPAQHRVMIQDALFVRAPARGLDERVEARSVWLRYCVCSAQLVLSAPGSSPRVASLGEIFLALQECQLRAADQPSRHDTCTRQYSARIRAWCAVRVDHNAVE